MLGWSGSPTAVSSLPAWNLLFAREPEPDLELDEGLEDLDAGKGGGAGGWSPKESKKPGGQRTKLLLLLVLVVAAGAYLMTSPGALLEMLGLGQPEVSIPTVLPPTAKAPKPDGVAVKPPATAAPAPSPQPAMSQIPIPVFREGQKVLLVADQAKPTNPVALKGDADGSKPGPSVPAGSTLTVLDGELKNNFWIYILRSDKGATGWVSETQLKPKS
jgi:hypothetical protein